jgi:hypothetical protein
MKTKTVTLPDSGEKVKFKAISPLNFGMIYGTAQQGDDVSTTLKIVCACCIAPEFAPHPEGDEKLKGKTSIETLSLVDYMFLVQEIPEFSGLNKALDTLGPTAQGKGGKSSSTSQRRSSGPRPRIGRKGH